MIRFDEHSDGHGYDQGTLSLDDVSLTIFLKKNFTFSRLYSIFTVFLDAQCPR